MVGAGSQPGLQPRLSLTFKSVHAKALLLLEKKLLKARGLPCHEVQPGEAAGCVSGLLRGSKARFGCCPCCRALRCMMPWYELPLHASSASFKSNRHPWRDGVLILQMQAASK